MHNKKPANWRVLLNQTDYCAAEASEAAALTSEAASLTSEAASLTSEAAAWISEAAAGADASTTGADASEAAEASAGAFSPPQAAKNKDITATANNDFFISLNLNI